MNQFPGSNYHDLNLDWLLNEMKTCLSEWAAMQTEWESTEQAWESLRQYVDNYFDNLDVGPIVNAKVSEIMTQMYNNGQLLALIQPTVATTTESAVTSWLNERISQDPGYVLDSNLLNPSAAAPAKTVGDKFAVAKNDIDASMDFLGNIGYWGNGGSVSASTPEAFTATQAANNVTLSMDGSTASALYYVKLNGTLQYTTNSTNYNNFTKDVHLLANHKYKIKSEIISGSVSVVEGHTSNGVIVSVRNANNTDIAKDGVASYGIQINGEAEFTITDATTAAITLMIYRYTIANNLALRITLVDLTVMNSNLGLNAKQNVLTFDSTPTENSTNPVTSGGVYAALNDSGIPAYYFADDYLQTKINTITERQNTIGVNQDAFWFISDYHKRYNEQHSFPLLKYLMARTGITKLIFGGDAGGSLGTSQSAVYYQIQQSVAVWQEMDGIAKEFYGVLGNHEYINTTYGNLGGMMGAYLNRFKDIVTMDPATGAYYVDNTANKIRTFFLQDNNSTYPVTGTLDWFKARLLEVPANYSVLVVMHYAYVPNAVTNAEFYGYDPAYNYNAIRDVSELLAGLRDKTDLTNSLNVDFSQLQGDRHIIGVFSGHLHHGFLYTEGTVSDIANIAVFEASTDSLLGGIGSLSKNGHPWFWKNGIVTGLDEDRIERTAGTIYEQCFYAVQIDMDAKKLYITAFGGDNDWSGFYEPSNE